MGKGGEQQTKNAKVSVSNTDQKLKLCKLSTEELRKWAKAYGMNAEASRDELLVSLNPLAVGILDPLRPANLPLEPPTFTLTNIRDAIPAHCFKRNLFTSLGYLFIDLVYIAAFGYAATYISSAPSIVNSLIAGLSDEIKASIPAEVMRVLSTYVIPNLPYALWPIYWFSQGSVMTGVWVLAHECGHQSFSESELANNIVGTICHSLLLVPYHSWRITHGKHHGNTGSCENDEVFAPATRSMWGNEMLRESPIAQLWGIFVMLSVGWMPGYLVYNATGPVKYRGKNANHFSPTAAFFKEDEYWLIVQTDIAFFAAVSLLGYCVYNFGFLAVATYYLLPYMVTNLFLVLITYLQHTDVFMPHFRSKEWTWLRGALCTVDRSFGFLLDRTLHHISDTHVCHHLFSKMPFYHAQEATEHIKRVLGPYHLKDDTPILHALWRSYSACQFIEDEGDVVFYKNIK
mmetsp:Transcript_30703/g.42035  ORF Transcript_30703/g.42035 Transcript_30703/m.42035 type:complete len:459 (+) Transcript_30703:107-1483(+)